MNNSIRPSLHLYHASPKCTGSALGLTLYPAHNERPGFLSMTICPQRTVGDIGNGIAPTFGFKDGIAVALDFTSVSMILQVLRGEIESINEGKGIFLKTATGSTVVKFAHKIDPVHGYHLSLTHKSDDGKSESTVSFFMNPAEACGICEALSQSMHLIAFGTGFEATSLDIERDEAIAKERAKKFEETVGKEIDDAAQRAAES